MLLCSVCVCVCVCAILLKHVHRMNTDPPIVAHEPFKRFVGVYASVRAFVCSFVCSEFRTHACADNIEK